MASVPPSGGAQFDTGKSFDHASVWADEGLRGDGCKEGILLIPHLLSLFAVSHAALLNTQPLALLAGKLSCPFVSDSLMFGAIGQRLYVYAHLYTVPRCFFELVIIITPLCRIRYARSELLYGF